MSAVAGQKMKDQLESERCARYMKALSEGDRLKIVETLLDGPRSVGEVAEIMRSPLQMSRITCAASRLPGCLIRSVTGSSFTTL